MIKKLIKDYQPEELAVVFDAKGKTFRDEWYPEYKAHRPPMPQELSTQFAPLIQLLESMGLPILIIEGVEADDVIGTLAKQATEQGIPVVISTGDKDMAQLVNEHITLINTMSNTTLDIEGVKEKFGIKPSQVIDYLTLIGDTVDNIPGITKCGPKTAVKWLTEYQTLDNLIHHADEIGGKIGEYLRASIPQLPLSQKLVTIKTDVDLPLSWGELKPEPMNKERLIELTREFEFKNWLKELLGEEGRTSTSKSVISSIPFELITTNQQLNHLLNQLEQCQVFCIDTETTSIDIMLAELVGISLAIEEGKAVYIPFMHTDGTVQLIREEVLTALKPVLENPEIKKSVKTSNTIMLY